VLVVATLVAGCSSGAGRPDAASTTGRPTATTTSAGRSTTTRPVARSSTSTRTSATTGPTIGTPSTSSASSCVVLANWSVPRLAAQLIVVPALDFDVDQLGAALRQGVGGALFLGNAPAPSDLAHHIAAADAQTGAAGSLLTMADEEGGQITRLAPLTSPVPWPRTMAATMTTAQVRALAATVGRQMRAAGVRLDLAPVADLDDGPGPSASNPDGERSFSNTPSVAAAYASAFAQGLAAGGELSTVKHFPGLGHSSGNTDNGPAHTLSLTQLDQGALPAFRGTLASTSAVMVANATVPGLTTGPASLSHAAIDDLLRTQLGWRGLVLTDSLSAGAIRATGLSLSGAAVQAVAAGADMVLFGSTLTPADTAQLSPTAVAGQTAAIVSALTSAVADGHLARSRVENAVSHVLAAKGLSLCP
jgi:beta-N-acetylhexosaminidase